MLRVNDIFHSVQGEGLYTGVPATFIRLQGCNLRCDFCDTGGALDKDAGLAMTEEDIVKKVENHLVVVTGGEPFFQQIGPLVGKLQSAGCQVNIETNGLRPVNEKFDYRGVWITLSPKRVIGYKAWHETIKHASEIKFVVEPRLASEDILTFIVRNRKYIPETATFIFMPEGCPPKPTMCEKAITYAEWLNGLNFPARVCDRLQWRFRIK